MTNAIKQNLTYLWFHISSHAMLQSLFFSAWLWHFLKCGTSQRIELWQRKALEVRNETMWLWLQWFRLCVCESVCVIEQEQKHVFMHHWDNMPAEFLFQSGWWGRKTLITLYLSINNSFFSFMQTAISALRRFGSVFKPLYYHLSQD